MADSATRSPESQRDPQKAHKTAVVIGVAMIASVFIYAVMRSSSRSRTRRSRGSLLLYETA